MKRFAIILVFCIQIGCICRADNPTDSAATPPPADKPGSVSFLDYRNGFLNFKFGEDINNYDPPQNFHLRLGGREKTYDYTAKITNIGDAPVKHFSVICLGNRVAGIAVFFDKSNFWTHQVKPILETAYGPGARSEKSTYELKWGGHTANCTFTEDTPSKDLLILIFNNDLQKQLGDIERDFIQNTSEQL